MIRVEKVSAIAFFIALLLSISFPAPVAAFSSSETTTFHQGPFAFKIEISVKGDGSLKKQAPLPITSIKLKMKNDRASSEVLRIKAIRVYASPTVFREVKTREFAVSPGQWVTKYFRLRKNSQVLLEEKGYIEIAFENFVIQFHPRERKFSGPA